VQDPKQTPYVVRLADAIREMTLFKALYEPVDADYMVDLVLRAAEEDKRKQQRDLSGAA